MQVTENMRRNAQGLLGASATVQAKQHPRFRQVPLPSRSMWRALAVLVACVVWSLASSAGVATAATPKANSAKSSTKKSSSKPQAAKSTPKPSTKSVASRRKGASKVQPKAAVRRASFRSRLRFWDPDQHRWLTPTFADSVSQDSVDGEDLTVRRAAVEALGAYNGSVVVVDPTNGRILTIVNQPLAMKPGFIPCSTVKVYAALAGLQEGVIDGTAPVKLNRWTSMTLTRALAKSDNAYFARIGELLGYDKIAYYGRLYGLGEPAGWNLTGEQPGTISSDAPPSGMGMMTSFGDGIQVSPLQLSALMGALANGGTLYWLQYPRTEKEREEFTPRVKRTLEIASLLEDVRPGLLGTTEFGTGARAAYSMSEPIFGKTGTCTDHISPTHLGWFTSFNEVNGKKLVVTVLLTGGRPINGPVAAGVAGNVYRALSEQGYFQPAPSLNSAVKSTPGALQVAASQ